MLLEHGRALRIASNAAMTSSRVSHAHLSLAVVAEARALDDARQQRVVDRRGVGGVAQHGERRDGEAVAGKERLLADAVLRDRDACRAGRHAQLARQKFQRRRRHVLELGRRGRAQRTQRRERSGSR